MWWDTKAEIPGRPWVALRFLMAETKRKPLGGLRGATGEL